MERATVSKQCVLSLSGVMFTASPSLINNKCSHANWGCKININPLEFQMLCFVKLNQLSHHFFFSVCKCLCFDSDCTNVKVVMLDVPWTLLLGFLNNANVDITDCMNKANFAST